jgi:peroxiredoxin
MKNTKRWATIGFVAMGASVGNAAPDFTLPSATGEQVSLSSFQGSKPVLLYFHMAEG